MLGSRHFVAHWRKAKRSMCGVFFWNGPASTRWTQRPATQDAIRQFPTPRCPSLDTLRRPTPDSPRGLAGCHSTRGPTTSKLRRLVMAADFSTRSSEKVASKELEMGQGTALIHDSLRVFSSTAQTCGRHENGVLLARQVPPPHGLHTARSGHARRTRQEAPGYCRPQEDSSGDTPTCAGVSWPGSYP